MAHLPEGQAQFEFTKMQLIGSLGAVAETMRNCAQFAEQFAQLITPLAYPGAPIMFPNGQLPPMPPPQMEQTGTKRKSRGGDEEVEGGKRKRKTKPKDPNAPKRPPSSYLLFQNEVRQELKQKHPTISNNELLAKIAKAWSEMPKEQKDRYEERQLVAKSNYLEQKKQYEQSTQGLAASGQQQQAVNPAVIAHVPAPVSPPAATSDEEKEEDEEKDEDGQESSSDESSDEEHEVPPSKKPKGGHVKDEPKEKRRKTKA